MKRLLLVLIASTASADCTIPEAIERIRPGAQYVIEGNAYEGLTWLDATQSKPTRTQLLNSWNACNTELSERQAALIVARQTVRDKTKPIEERFDALLLLLRANQ